jgi:hypothetical protein
MGRRALLSIASGCINRGNLIIEHATRHVLGLDEDTLLVNAHETLSDNDVAAINSCDALILPGATLLQPGDHPAVEQLPLIRCPVFAIGVALRSELDVADLSIARHLEVTIGSRDPFTHDALRSHGRRTALVGCQTLLMARAERWQSRQGPIVFCPGLGDLTVQQACITACADVAPTIVLHHAPATGQSECRHAQVSHVDLHDARQAFTLFASASVVVTGRLHALLSCIALGTPAIVLGGWYDSRYSLLDLLGVPVEPPVPARIQRLVARVLNGTFPPDACLAAANTLRAGMLGFIHDVGGPLGVMTRVTLH